MLMKGMDLENSIWDALEGFMSGMDLENSLWDGLEGFMFGSDAFQNVEHC